MAGATFDGFERRLLAFLRELERNNTREWFQANREQFREDVQEPVLAFVRAVRPRLARISRLLVADDRKAGGSMLRMQRDLRFTRDPTPYFASVALRFVHEEAEPGEAPGFFLRIAAREITLGAGIPRPGTASLARLRAHLAEHPARWRRVRDGSALRSAFPDFRGATLKRAPRGFDPESPLLDDLRRKSYLLTGSRRSSALFTPDFLEGVVSDYRTAAGFVRFLCQALALPWRPERG